MRLSKRTGTLNGVRLSQSSPILTMSRMRLMRVVSFCLQDMLVGRPRDAYIPVPEDGPPSRPAAPERAARVRLKHQRCFCVLLLLGLVARGQASPDHYPHQPFRWVIRHLSSGKVLKGITTPNTPSFILRFTDLFPGRPKVDPYSPHVTQTYLSYWCPASNPGKSYCNHPGWGYCGHWGCETIVTDARPSGPGWDPQEPDRFLQFTWAPTGCKTPFFFHGNFHRNSHKIPKFRKCTNYNMTVLQPDHPSWTTGRTWTVAVQGSKEWVNVQIIRLPASMSQSVGPNPVLVVSKPREEIAVNSSSSPDTQKSELVSPSSLLAEPNLSNSFINVLNATFISLNQSNPNFTESCWLCYDAQPPFYEGVAFDLPFIFSKSNNPRQCRWDTPRRGITLSQVTGQGKCFGNATLARQTGSVCKEFGKLKGGKFQWVIPAASGMWVCHRSGVSPCVLLDKFDHSNDFCVQVLIVPRVLYHSDEEVYYLFEQTSRLHKREILTGLTIAMLLGLGAAGTATGVSALATQHQGLSQLQMTIDEDLQRIEKSISSLEKSLSSLSEVVLQNRRGLDLLFMQQGGLCAALKEECCFYADHTGVVRDSMAELRNWLNQRKMDREAQQGWFESWFNQSPWLTTLISTLIGPITIILLTLIFGPCV
uniref:MLV-related proviral Env polyprotein-like n=1 Tax=Serinus canaria TaxID=9135 RepID=A0A8C9KVA0_SERCA